ncbi:hypothetical protein GCM10025862_30680 [Arsenicicoccus piscis]|uniref:Uncharacterized protein n=1 Tax=Arsenicicoccus piscis TaxID=673954 RepID=A0ABQ6HST2_9MICO|nr:hypothetical protein GCM10025862_30680 [Arsenicicoccus piscis]
MAASVAVSLALVACSAGDAAVVPTAAASGGGGSGGPVGAAATSAGVGAGAGAGGAAPSADMTAPESVATPVPEFTAPTTVAATTAGPLSAKDFPTFPGWSRGIGEGDDGRYLPNGTWVHDVVPRLAVADLMAQGCAERPADVPTPTAALGATYVGPKQQPGTALALAFGTAAEAQSFAALYRSRAQGCARNPAAGLPTTVLSTAPRLVDRKDLGTDGMWVELAQPQGARFVVAMLADPDGSLWRRGAGLASWGAW